MVIKKQPMTLEFSSWLRELLRKFKVSSPHLMRTMTAEDVVFLQENIDFHNLTTPDNLALFRQFTPESREQFAFETKTFVTYLHDETTEICADEEKSALMAMPAGYELSQLNGVNIGCGGRRINPLIIPIDIMRSNHESLDGAHSSFLDDAVLANPSDLPFKQESLDYILALHMLEHIIDPVSILRYWHSLLKPGGGIGIILPDYRYTWNAEYDGTRFGHKWNPEPDLVQNIFHQSLSDIFEMEHFNTLKRKISFNTVLRKPGVFKPFQIIENGDQRTGSELYHSGDMLGSRLQTNAGT